MPEIAEVETVRQTLLKQIINEEIKDVKIIYDKIINLNPTEFKEKLINQKIIDIKRKGKWLIFELSDYYLLSHLRMEGKYFLKSDKDPLVKHEHLIFYFKDHKTLRYHDTRKFGRMILINKEELNTQKELIKLGIEPNDQNLTKEYLKEKLSKKNIPIKNLLLDQTIISGLGNIYASEVLYSSSINPTRLGKELNDKEFQNIVNACNDVITKAIEAGGTTISSYTSSLGVTGRFQQQLKVYKQTKCQKCNSDIIKIKQSGRATYYCPKCQKK